jgi:TPR repeat protein
LALFVDAGANMRQRITTLFAGGALALALFGVAAAGPFKDGGAAYDQGDYVTAMRLFRPLANQGDALAQTTLGEMYASGKGAPQDYAQALVWLRMAADKGFAPAQDDLSEMYAEGEGVPQDYVLAYMWADLAASRATDAMIRDIAAKDRDAVAAKMTPDQIPEAQRMASKWKPK